MDSNGGSRKILDEELMHVSGGDGEPPAPNKPLPPCPNCGTDGYTVIRDEWTSEDDAHLYMDLFCRRCQGEWSVRYY